MKLKNNIIIIIAISVVLVIAFCFVWSSYNRNQKVAINSPEQTNNLPEGEIYQPRPVVLEFMGGEEQKEINIAVPKSERIQVVERDASGTPTVYRIIKSDGDIVTEY